MLVAQIPEGNLHYGMSALLPGPLRPADGIVVQYEVQFSKGHTCGGAYLKLISQSDKPFNPNKLKSKTPFSIMFGPDRCGPDSRVRLPPGLQDMLPWLGSWFANAGQLVPELHPCCLHCKTQQRSHNSDCRPLYPTNPLQAYISMECVRQLLLPRPHVQTAAALIAGQACRIHLKPLQGKYQPQ